MSRVLKRHSDGFLFFKCPGCDEYHKVWTDRPGWNNSELWQWNGDYEKPTFSPSLKVLPTGSQPRCHFFIEEGMFHYQADCGHKLAGKTVAMHPLDYNVEIRDSMIGSYHPKHEPETKG